MSDKSYKSQNHIKAAVPAILVLFGLLLWIVQPVQAAVTLIYFNATPGDGQVLLEWATATELNNVGFFVVRSDQSNGTYNRVSDFIPGEGDSLVGATYDFTDTGLTNGQTYWYKLESVDINNTSQFDGPKSAVPGVPAQATATATQTATATTEVPDTSTPTPTATQTAGSVGTATATETQAAGATSTFTPTPSLTSTPTRTPTRTATRTSVSTFLPTRTQTPFPTRTSIPDTQSAPATETVIPGGGAITTEGATSPDQSPTATLIPLPTLNLVFSEDTPTPTLEPAASQDQGGSPWATPQRLVPLGFIVLIWVILGGWFYFSQRRLG